MKIELKSTGPFLCVKIYKCALNIIFVEAASTCESIFKNNYHSSIFFINEIFYVKIRDLKSKSLQCDLVVKD